MNNKWINEFVGPHTGLPMVLNEGEGSGQDIISGQLSDGVDAYPIIDGVPVFVTTAGDIKEDQTVDSFGRLWTTDSYMPSPNQSDAVKASLSEQLFAMVGCPRRGDTLEELVAPGARVLNAGCGTGWTEVLFQTPHAKRYAIDISEAVRSAYQATRHIENTVVVQANIAALPFPDDYFDMIISNGVLHHTANPAGCFQQLIRKLKPGGLIGVYVYCVKPFLRELADVAIRSKTTNLTFGECQLFASQMTRLGESLAAITEPIKIHQDIPLLEIKAGEYNLQRFVYDNIVKCFYNGEMGAAYSDGINVDWYHPQYATHHTQAEIDGWFATGGCGDVVYVAVPGWEHSGYFVSGIKRKDNHGG